MFMKLRRVLHLGILTILLAACTRSVSTPAATATLQLIPTQTSVPRVAVNLELTACVATDEAVRIRQGPGTTYEAIGALAPAACITILGRNSDSSWVYMETADGYTGWVAAFLLTIEGDLSKVAEKNNDDDPVTSQSPSIELCTNIANLIGSNVTCKIEPAYCTYVPDVDDRSTFCTDKPYPDHFVQLVVPGEDWSEYNGSCLVVTGLLESYFNGQEGLLQIIGHDRSQVSLCQ
jgi:uncharacterized protein YraI